MEVEDRPPLRDPEARFDGADTDAVRAVEARADRPDRLELPAGLRAGLRVAMMPSPYPASSGSHRR
ncbi:hypothetical protein GCM10023216_27010 [Isoptericola chiayiensis]|uniref:Uncharacterized protein n=1 Tax=Isoptericola chiayiensis TaxID=579446 RepID=A0ABP8YN36_9MICO|nr:hypothetical protein [Isoptericola chiayiensis]NOW01509.1 hypothetical protein [Isoptericola chiayiensis]